jgi:nucleotide-binding universal stress UspA family protein
MKILIPVDGSKVALAPIEHLAGLQRSGVAVEAMILNVQPLMHRHVARFTTRAAREALRAERSQAAMTAAIEAASQAGLSFRVLAETGKPGPTIAAVAEREGASEIMMGVGRHPAWMRWVNPSIAQNVMQRTDIPVTVLSRGRAGLFERYAVPAGAAGIAALFWAAE